MVTIIVACDYDMLIGVDNRLPWHSPEDLKHFRDTTLGHAVVMGRGTFDSISHRHLPGRLNVVISRAGILDAYPGLVVVDSHEKALLTCKGLGYKEVFIIGGESVYKEALHYADRILMTVIPHSYQVGGERFSYFPSIPPNWRMENCIDKTGLSYITFIRA